MKRISLITLIICLVSLANAQPPGGPGGGSEEHRERIKAHKVAFITTKLDLTAEEAQLFWPVYNDHHKKVDALHKERRQLMKGKKLGDLNDSDVEKIVDGEMEFRRKEVDLLESYHAKYKSILPVKKVAKLYRAEEEFKRELLRKMRESRGGPPPRGRDEHRSGGTRNN